MTIISGQSVERREDVAGGRDWFASAVGGRWAMVDGS